MLYSTFAHYLNELNPSVFHIFLHHNADPDALGAAQILKFMITKLNINHEIKIYSDNLNVLSKRMVNEFEVVVSIED